MYAFIYVNEKGEDYIIEELQDKYNLKIEDGELWDIVEEEYTTYWTRANDRLAERLKKYRF